jgi:hypothetical protein
MRVALEIEHRIDNVFEHARPGQRPFLGDVANQHDGNADRFGQPRQLRRTFAHLCHRAGGRAQLVRPKRLDRIDDGHQRFFRLQRGKNLFQVDLGQQLQLAGVQR